MPRRLISIDVILFTFIALLTGCATVVDHEYLCTQHKYYYNCVRVDNG